MTYSPRTTPYDHQQRALDLSWSLPEFALFMEMGTGKTKVVIDNIGLLQDAGCINAAVVLAPKGVYMNWVDKELPIHMPDALLRGALLFAWRGGKSESQKRQIEDLLGDSGHFKILVMNVEALSTGDRAYDLLEAFMRMHDCMMVVDESTTIKSYKASRSKAVVGLGRLAKYRRIMSGMPVTRSPLDVFNQFEFLRPGMLGFSSYFAFRARYAVIEQKYFGRRTVKVVTGYKNEADLQQRVARHSYRVLKEDCLDLPPKVYEQRVVELTEEQQRVYNQVRDSATSELSTGDYVTATEVIVQLIRLHQISCGHVRDELGVSHDLPETRTRELLNCLEEVDGQAIIWFAYRRDLERVATALQDVAPCVQYHGGTSHADRRSALQHFADGSARYFLGTPHTGGWGLNLVSAGTVVYYSNTYDLEKRAQSEDRAHRIGQKHERVTYIDLVAPGTVDEKILKVLRAKINIATAITGDGYKQWLI